MEETAKDLHIESLKNALEEMTGIKMLTPRHFEQLREVVFERTGQYLSATTLKRIWGYLNEPLNTRISTLALLSQTLGYKDWDDFIAGHDCPTQANELPSTQKVVKYIDVPIDLTPGQLVTLYWYPNRECTIRYLGNISFQVVESKETHLQAGDCFDCHLILSGQPLYLSKLQRDNSTPTAYICGKMHGGIQFKVHPFTTTKI